MHSITIAAVFLLAVGQVTAINHGSFARRHTHHRLHKRFPEKKLAKRGACEFPRDAGLVAVTPEAENAGWALSPDQPCLPGNWCPYACPPGQLMAQWNPKATSYKYPESMEGGLYCDEDGEISKPFPNKPYCYDGTGSVTCKNKAPKPVAFCQTVLPGNEAMLIPTDVDNDAVLAVPDPSYWAGTAAHYYINPPGVSHEEACVWGTKEKPVGNWSPYVAGANAAKSGETFVKLGWNPIYIEPDVPFRDVVPDWGVRIECDGDCSGLPCEIDPAIHGVNECSQSNAAGAGGANFCVVAVPKGVTATIVVFDKADKNSDDIKVQKPKTEDKEEDNKEDKTEDKEEDKTEVKEVKEDETEVKEVKTEVKEVKTEVKEDDRKDGHEESVRDDQEEIPKEPSSSYVIPPTSSAPQKTATSSSSSSAKPSSTSSEEEYSSSFEKSKPSTTFERTNYQPSASGYAPYPTNGTVPSASEAPTPEEIQPASSASSTTFPTLALLLAVACSMVLL